MSASTAEGLLALLQISDSAFPTGTFTHSYGLEQLAREGRVGTAEELARFAATVLRQSLATSEAPAAYRAALAADADDMAAVIEADAALYRLKASAELREASTATGRRLVEETAVHIESPLLATYAAAMRDGRAPGCQPVAYGVVAATLGVSAGDVPAALLLGGVNAIVQAAMRLLRFSHRDAQAVLHRLRPEIARLSLAAQAGDAWPPRSFHPLQEIASMRHAAAEARLFMS